MPKKRVTLVSRLRLDSRLFDDPPPVSSSRRGPKPKKGKRLPSLKDLADDTKQEWEEHEVHWYGGKQKRLKLLTGVCLWHTPGEQPIPIRWVLSCDPDGKARTEAFFSTDTSMDPANIVELFVWRWGVEVTFEEVRRHLGVETQRQWSDLAIARTTPVLLALFSIVVLIANHILRSVKLVQRKSAWYAKGDVTFSDLLALVRRWIWAEKYFVNSVNRGDAVVIPLKQWESLLDQLAAVA